MHWLSSTHEAEEEAVLAAHAQLKQKFPDLLLVVVPRHPERFAEVRKLIEQHQFSCVSRTQDRGCEVTTDVFLLDTMGELPLFYAASDIAFVGGSLVPVGGHNLLEPAALGLPVISGPNVFNAQEIADMFVDEGACEIVQDAPDLANEIEKLLADPDAAKAMGERGRDIVESNRGSLAKLLGLLEPLIGDS